MCWEAQTLTSTPDDDLDPQWSPDGTQIAFVGHHEGNPEVYVLDIATHAIRNVSNMPEDDYRPMWSRDGHYLAFIHRLARYSNDAGQPVVVDVVSEEQVFVSEGTTHSARWSADGRRLLFIQDRTRYLSVEADPRAVRELFSVPSSNMNYLTEAASPDGSWALLEVNAYPAIEETGTYVINTESGNVEKLLNDNSQNHVWSTDSTHLAFTTGDFPYEITLYAHDVSTHQMQDIYRMEANGWIYPRDWSPDNRLVWIVVTAERKQATSLFTEAPSGQVRELLRIDHPVGSVRWSPTRDQIAFQTYAGIYVADVPSGTIHEFVQGLGRIESMVWSPDGNSIAATLQQSFGNTNRMVITDIRTDRIYIYGEENPSYIRSQAQWSPDSEQLVFSASEPPAEAELVVLSSCEI
jgi:Tol biopolymer transport system component